MEPCRRECRRRVQVPKSSDAWYVHHFPYIQIETILIFHFIDWMASPGHRKNILGDFTNFGAGYTPNGDYWTQEFTRANVQTGSAIDCSNLFQGSNWLVDEQSVRSKFTSQGYCNAPGGTIATPSATVVIETAVPSPTIVPIQTPSPVVYITAPKKPVYDSAPAYPTAVKAPCPRSARRLSRR